MVSGTPLATMADLAQANLAMWQQMQDSLSATMKPKTPPSPEPAPASAAGPAPEPEAATAPPKRPRARKASAD
jgi:hypothetical protein